MENKDYLSASNTQLTAAESLLNKIRDMVAGGNEEALDLVFILGETIKKLKQELVLLNFK